MKISTFLYLLLLTILVLQPARLRAQNYLLPVAGTASYTTCTGTLYDDGGPDALYDTEAKGSVTLRPGTAGGKLKLAFSLLELDSVRSSVTVYDGLDTNAPYIGRFYHGLPTVYATGSTGALTIVLASYGGQARRGMAAAISCVTGVPPTDLAAQSLRLSATGVPTNDSFTAEVRIANLSGPLNSYRLNYLLSTDNVAGYGDVPLGTSTWSLAQGDWTFNELSLRVPTGTAPGTYYVLCEAIPDALNDISYLNNTAAAPLTVLAQTPRVDLALTDVSAPAPRPVTVSMPFYVKNRVQNLGRTVAIASQMGYYFSADATLSPDDALLGTAPAEMALIDKYIVAQTELTLPPGTALGTYYLLSVADYDDQVIEDNEQNNVFAQRLTVVPPTTNVGFESTRTVAPTQPMAGGSLYVRCSAQNKGSSVVDSVGVGYYLSADATLSPDDVLLDQLPVGPLLVWAFTNYSLPISRTLTVPVGTPPGKRYLLLVADPRNQLAESDETDNLVAIALDIAVPVIDLTISSLRYTSAYPPATGTPLVLRYTLANLGTTQAYPVGVGYFLSTDNQLSADDVPLPLRSQQGTLLAGGASQVMDVSDLYSPFLPASTAPGAYYLLAVADPLQQIAETNETNNVAAVALQVGVPVLDLTLTFKPNMLPAQASAGAVLNLGYYVNNAGSTPAATPSVGFYLSTDAQLSSNDILIGGGRLRNTAYPSYYIDGSSKPVVPPTLAPGNYYLLGAVDDLNDFAETNETNNVQAVALAITAARPDVAWQQTPYLTPRQAVAGSLVTTESYVYNLGAGLADATAVGYYLSADPVFSADDVLMGRTPVAPVQPGYSATVEGTFTVPAATASGRYYVLFVADPLLALDDSNRSNNVIHTTITVTPLPLATREQTAGYALQVSPVPVARATPLLVQFSGAGIRTEAALILYNSMGQEVFSQSLALAPGQRNQAAVSTANLAAGVYILHLTGPGLNAVRRVVVE
ncbi:CARDB domain-containing protein [Hymenobacter bucti]|uniref:CARDB domain-containing protein n=1 Tax=Hymenobacter bucti TaxID=1844114 RepID=A0ABW4QVI5_9BACT